MKKLSLLSLLWLVALVAMPTYAQDVQDAEDVVYNVETSTYGDDEVLPLGEDVSFDYGVDEEGVTLETAVEDLDFSALFENEEVKAALDEAGLTNEEAAWLLGLFTGAGMTLGIGWIIFCLVWCILLVIAWWKIFVKAGEKWWKILIPIYNVYIWFKIVGMKNWFWWMLLVPFCLWLIAGFAWAESAISTYLSIASSLFAGIIGIVATFKLPRKFGWGVFTSILFVLFTGICTLILGFGNYKYEGKSEEIVVEA